MNYLDDVFLAEEAAAELGLTVQRVRQLAREGKFTGAQLRGQRIC